MKAKYKVGQVLYFKDCSIDYQVENVFTVKNIEENKRTWFDEDNIEHTTISFSYSQTGFSWFQENDLADTIEEIDLNLF